MTDIQSLLALGVYLFILFVVMYWFISWVFSQAVSEKDKTHGARTRIFSSKKDEPQPKK